MNVSARKFLLGLLAFAAVLCAALAASPLMLFQPIFRIGYALSGDKARFLQSYDAQLAAHAGWYIPERADAFLCARLRDGAPDAESAAIVDFYAAKSYGRLGNRIFRLPGESRERIVGLAMARMSRYSPQRAADALVFVESLRQGEGLGKARLIWDGAGAEPGYSVHLERVVLPKAERSFSQWWRRDEPWSIKSKRDPLAGTGLTIEAP